MKNLPKPIFLAIIAATSSILLGLIFFLFNFTQNNDFISPLGSTITSQILEKPLEKYTVLNLGKYQAKPSQIVKEKVLKENENYISYLVSFNSKGKKVTGMMNIPVGTGPFPVIVMFRGYVDPEIYFTGLGTERVSEVFASNGFITIAPDFLGYGGSDLEAENVFESRFETYTVALDTLASVSNIENADATKVSIWGHSNGGQISLTILEASQNSYPTVLWAPVTKPFPYSILYYTDEASDRGKFLRKELSKFESEYNADLYSITDYVGRITAPIQLHQGSADEAVPQKWSDEFVKLLTDREVKVTYYTYSGADHNLMPASPDASLGGPGWNTVVQRDIEFFQKNLQ